MAKHRILLVDDQRDILRLLRATLDTLGHDFDIHESPSGEEALLESTRGKVDLLVVDYRLPGISGVELMDKVRARNPEVKAILVTGTTDKKARDEMLNAGAFALFDKPISLGDFLDAVERSLGLTRTIMPAETATEGGQSKPLADLLVDLRKDIKAQVVYLITDRGRVLARAGELYDSSMEVSLLSSLTAVFSAAQKTARFAHQETNASTHIFRGGDGDILLVPVTAGQVLFLMGDNIAAHDTLAKSLDKIVAVRGSLESSLSSMGLANTASSEEKGDTLPMKPQPVASAPAKPAAPEGGEKPEDIEKLLSGGKKDSADADSFWTQALETGAQYVEPDKLTYEQARKLGLAPDEKKP